MSVTTEGIDHIETTCSSVADDLAAHVQLVETLLQYFERLGRNALVVNSSDVGRDLLHLEARVLGIARQLEDAIATLNRLRGRFDVDAS